MFLSYLPVKQIFEEKVQCGYMEGRSLETSVFVSNNSMGASSFLQQIRELEASEQEEEVKEAAQEEETIKAELNSLHNKEF